VIILPHMMERNDRPIALARDGRVRERRRHERSRPTVGIVLADLIGLACPSSMEPANAFEECLYNALKLPDFLAANNLRGRIQVTREERCDPGRAAGPRWGDERTWQEPC
jgi:hypothetical protein